MCFYIFSYFVFILLSSITGSVDTTTCELGWLKDPHSTNCFRFFPAALSWKDARNSCVGQGGLLAVIHNSNTNDFITKNVTRGLRSWIGLHKQDTNSSTWEWNVVDRVVGYKNWASGEPSNSFWSLFKSQECAEIEDASGLWSDEPCDSTRSYVCQKSLGCNTTSLKGYTPNLTSNITILSVGTSVTVDSHCRVGYRPNPKTTQASCVADGAWSVAPITCSEISCTDPSNSRLLNGLIYPDPATGPYGVGSKIRYSCDIGYMLRGNAVSVCRDLDPRLPVGIWDQPPICLTSPSCEDGWVSHNNYCYRHVKDLLSWGDADIRCQELGGSWSRLVSINSPSENKLVELMTNNTVSELWIGLHDVPSEGIWEWTDNSAVAYKNFAPGEPNNGQFFWETEDCVEMDIATGRWNDEQCDSLREFVCEKFIAN